jgi:hypothetical protein
MHSPTVNHEMPEGPWMRRLQKDSWIWLCKEQQYAKTVFPWQPPPPGRRWGELALSRIDEQYDKIQIWYVGPRGEGFDGTQLILPCEGHLSETLAEIIDKKETDLFIILERIQNRLDLHHIALSQMNAEMLFLLKKIEELEEVQKKQILPLRFPFN